MNMDRNSYTFSEAQNKAIELFMQGKNKTDVATACEVSRATVYNWLEIPQFRHAIEKERGDLFKRAQAQLKHLFHTGIKTAERVLNDPDNKSFARVFEIICKAVGVLDEKPNVNIIVLNAVDPFESIQELQKHIMDRVPLLTEEQKQKLIIDDSDTGEVS